MTLLVLPTVPSSLVSHFLLCDAENKFAEGEEQDDDNNDDKENIGGDVKPCFKKAKVSTTFESNSAALGFHKKQMWMRGREKIRFASPHEKSSHNSWNSLINIVTEQNG
jgi:hypothetical protein